MSTKIQTPPFGAIPPFPYHAITMHLPGWHHVNGLMEKDPKLFAQIKSMYPRMMQHRDIKALAGKIMEKLNIEQHACQLFFTPDAATQCKAFGLSKLRKSDALQENEISIRVVDIDIRYYAVFFPVAKAPIMGLYWSSTGLGISSRAAEESLKHIDLLHEVTDGTLPPPKAALSPVYATLQQRIVDLLHRAPVSEHPQRVSPGDVYLFQSGMSAIHTTHQLLLSQYKASTVLFGFAFHSTIHVFEDFEPNPGFKFFGLGTAPDLDELESWLESENREGRRVQALYAEFPANPILVTPDLVRLRSLADKYKFVIIIDDTIGSFSNVDLLGVADIIITSLTKTFSGYADVLGASLVLNPNSSLHPELKVLFEKTYQNDMYIGDAEVLENNSRDYLPRSTISNNNTDAIASYLHEESQKADSCVAKVWYPKFLPSLSNYTPWMRPATDEFTPGYGCLFSVELKNMTSTAAFYDALNVHFGPHFGAPLTLCFPYIKALYGKQLDWVGNFDLKETQLRIAPGQEDTDELLDVFKEAVEKGNGALVVDSGVISAT